MDPLLFLMDKSAVALRAMAPGWQWTHVGLSISFEPQSAWIGLGVVRTYRPNLKILASSWVAVGDKLLQCVNGVTCP